MRVLPLYMTELFQCLFWAKTFAFAVPLEQTIVYKKIMDNLLKFARECRDILGCQYSWG